MTYNKTIVDSHTYVHTRGVPFTTTHTERTLPLHPPCLSFVLVLGPIVHHSHDEGRQRSTSCAHAHGGAFNGIEAPNDVLFLLHRLYKCFILIAVRVYHLGCGEERPSRELHLLVRT